MHAHLLHSHDHAGSDQYIYRPQVLVLSRRVLHLFSWGKGFECTHVRICTPNAHTHMHTQVPGEKDFGDSEMISGPVAMLDDVPMPMLNLSSDGEEEGGGG